MKEKTTMRPRVPHVLRVLLAIQTLFWVGGLPAPAADTPDAAKTVDRRADELLRRSSDFLAHNPFFSVNAEIWQDAVLASGQRVQASRTVDLQVRRPDRLHAEVRSTRRDRGLWYDGKTITVLNRNHDLYGVVNAPSTLDEMLDVSMSRLGVAIPLDDLLVSNPYATTMKNVTSGTDIGPTMVLGVQCEHLAFSQPDIDWQIWIQTGPRPVPRKMVITYKDEEGSPQYTTLLSNWDFLTKLPDFVFTFDPPANASKINMVQPGATKELGAPNPTPLPGREQ
jgi:hypothetical protein